MGQVLAVLINSKLACFLWKGMLMVKGRGASPSVSCVRMKGELSSLQAVVVNDDEPGAAHLYFPGRHVGSVDVRAAPSRYLTLLHSGYLQYQLNR